MPQTRLKTDLRYFPDRAQSEHPQCILFAFFEAARNNFSMVYGTKGKAIIDKMKIGNSELFSSELAMVLNPRADYKKEYLTINVRVKIKLFELLKNKMTLIQIVTITYLRIIEHRVQQPQSSVKVNKIELLSTKSKCMIVSLLFPILFPAKFFS